MLCKFSGLWDPVTAALASPVGSETPCYDIATLFSPPSWALLFLLGSPSTRHPPYSAWHLTSFSATVLLTALQENVTLLRVVQLV